MVFSGETHEIKW